VQLKAFVTGRGIRLSYSEDLNGADGASSGGAIRIRSGLAPAEEFAVVAHELAHELLHHGQDRAQTPRHVQEVEAEAVAFIVSEAIGLDTNSACADYIQLYQGSVETLTESLESIQLASSLILSELMPEEPHAAAA